MEYQIITNSEAIVRFCEGSFRTVFARNSIGFRGKRARVTEWRTPAAEWSVEIVFIPSSLIIFRLDDFCHSALQHLVFEFGSHLDSFIVQFPELESIKSIFIPQSVTFISSSAFSGKSLSFVLFARHCTLKQLISNTFVWLDSLSLITIPASVRAIHHRAFTDCNSLCSVKFESDSHCWYISRGAFCNCPKLNIVTLPASIEVIDQTRLDLNVNRTLDYVTVQYFVEDSPYFCVKYDCLQRNNGRELIQYQGNSSAHSVSEKITILANKSFT
jgi:hypothetical protein